MAGPGVTGAAVAGVGAAVAGVGAAVAGVGTGSIVELLLLDQNGVVVNIVGRLWVHRDVVGYFVVVASTRITEKNNTTQHHLRSPNSQDP